MGLRAVSPLAAVYSSVFHRVFFKLCHVFCVSVWWTGATAGACMFGRAHACILVARSVLCLLFALLAVLRAFPWALVIGVGGCECRERNDWLVG